MGTPEATRFTPVFILGRQHCGNTMLAEAFGRLPEFVVTAGECSFFDELPEIRRTPRDQWPQRVVAAMLRSTKPPLKESEVRALEPRLRGLGDPEGWTPETLYAQAHAMLAEDHGASHWCKKATSYIFHVPELLDALPAARLIFLIRNPLDLAASNKRRSGFESVPRMLLGWQRGVSLALRFREEHPEHLRVVRYEDLVRPESDALAETMRFAGASRPLEHGEVPRVNTADAPYQRNQASQGVVGTSAYGYARHLTPAEIATVRRFTSDALLQTLYPELLQERPANLAQAARSLARPAASLAVQGVRAVLREPRGALLRVVKRLR